MKIKIIIFVSVLAIVSVTFIFSLSLIEERAKEFHEEGNYCESYKLLKWTSLISSESKYFLASIYAGGLCGSQNISKAKALYEAVYGDNNAIKIGRALFLDAFKVVDMASKNNEELESSLIQILFKESKDLGFVPNIKETEEMENKNILEYYQR